MTKLSKDKKQKLILICICIAGIVGVLYTYVLAAQKEVLNGHRNRTDNLRDKLLRAERAVKSRRILTEQFAESKAKLDLLQKDMAPANQYYWFLSLLNDFVARNKFKANFFQDLSQPQTNTVGLLPEFPYQSVVFTVTASGHYHEVGRFLAQFENEYPLVRFVDLRLLPDSAGLGGGRVLRSVESGSGAGERLGVVFKVYALMLPPGG